MIESAVSFNQIPEAQVPQDKSVIRKTGRLALRAAFIGFFVDMFDVYLPIVALGGHVLFSAGDAQPCFEIDPVLRRVCFIACGSPGGRDPVRPFTVTRSVVAGSPSFPWADLRWSPC